MVPPSKQERREALKAVYHQARDCTRCPQLAATRTTVVFGSGKRYFGSVDAQHLLEDPHTVIQGDRVLHLRYKVRRS